MLHYVIDNMEVNQSELIMNAQFYLVTILWLIPINKFDSVSKLIQCHEKVIIIFYIKQNKSNFDCKRLMNVNFDIHEKLLGFFKK